MGNSQLKITKERFVPKSKKQLNWGATKSQKETYELRGIETLKCTMILIQELNCDFFYKKFPQSFHTTEMLWTFSGSISVPSCETLRGLIFYQKAWLKYKLKTVKKHELGANATKMTTK